VAKLEMFRFTFTAVCNCSWYVSKWCAL